MMILQKLLKKMGFSSLAPGNGLFTSTSKPTSTQTIYDPNAPAKNAAAAYLAGQVGKTGPSYNGELVAPLSDAQNKSQDVLKDYANNPNSYTGGQGYQDAINQLDKTVTGGYDPSTSPYYQAMKAEAARNNSLALQQVDNQAGMGNRFNGGARLQAEGNVNAQTANNENAILGQLSQQDIQNRLTASPQLAALSAAQTQMPAEVSQNLQTLGALPQQNQQAYDTAVLNQWMNQNYNYPLSIAQLAEGGTATPLTTSIPQTTTDYSGLGSILGAGGASNPFMSAINGALPAIGAAASGAGASIASFLPALLSML